METNQQNKFSWLKDSIGLKIFIIGFLILLMLIPSGMIKDLMRERKGRLFEAKREVTSKWGDEQRIAPVILTVPCVETYKKDEKEVYRTKYIHILPDAVNIEGKVNPKLLHRGIFEVLVYNTKVNITGYYDSISLSRTEFKDCDILWDKAELSIGISDPRGIGKNIVIHWNGRDIKTIPGTGENSGLQSGVHVPINIKNKQKNKFSLELDLNGSGMLGFLPLGKETNVDLTSVWPHPQFDGAYIPKHREVNDSGFIANWSVLEHNRDFPQMWMGNQSLKDSAFGVQLIKPVDVYQKSMRAIKYYMLFIILTFLVFLFSELIIGKKAHPVQYIMVGSALCIFFSLLIALSEHIHFNIAYFIASATIILMISMFTKSVFSNIKVSGIVFLVLVLLFAFLFVILQLTDYSLILGNVGLVIALAIIMFVSRKIDWYNEKKVTDEKKNQ